MTTRERPWPSAMATRRSEGSAALGQLPALTGLRFLAALLVVVFHYGLRTHLRFPRLFSVGFVGVSFFFVLSGFILAYTYLDPQGRLRVPARDFWVARVARIYPAYLFALIVALGPFLWLHHSLASRTLTVVTALTLTQAWLPNPAGTAWNPPGWSLSAEAFFYLLFPVCAVAVARLDRRRLSLTLGLLWGVSVVLAAVLGLLQPARGDFDAAWSWERILNYNPLVRLPEFLMGIALGRLFVDRLSTQTTSRRRLADPGVWSVVTLAAIVVALSWAAALPSTISSTGLCAPLFGLLIYTLAFNRGPLAALLATPVMVLLGEASYAVYILHYPLWDWMNRLLGQRLPMGAPATFAVYLVVVVGVALLSLTVVERPARRTLRDALGRRVAGRPRAGAEGTADIQPAR